MFWDSYWKIYVKKFIFAKIIYLKPASLLKTNLLWISKILTKHLLQAVSAFNSIKQLQCKIQVIEIQFAR